MLNSLYELHEYAIDHKCDVKLYADGGLVKSNPSKVGGSWAWCAVMDDELLYCESGFIKSEPYKLVTNNQTEYYAILRALEAMPDNWCGEFYTDSQISLSRIFSEKTIINGLRDEWIDRKFNTLDRLGDVQGFLVKGHPTRKELEEGVSKRGVLVSKWNVLCDELCREQNALHTDISN